MTQRRSEQVEEEESTTGSQVNDGKRDPEGGKKGRSRVRGRRRKEGRGRKKRERTR